MTPGTKLVDGTCACGHVGKQKLPDVCCECSRKPKTPFVDGQCACGHVGRQKRPDICGSCYKEENKTHDPKQRRRTWEREAPMVKAKHLVVKFKQLDYAHQQYVLHELIEHNKNR